MLTPHSFVFILRPLNLKLSTPKHTLIVQALTIYTPHSAIDYTQRNILINLYAVCDKRYNTICHQGHTYVHECTCEEVSSFT